MIDLLNGKKMIYDLVLSVIKSFPNNTNFYSLSARQTMALKITQVLTKKEKEKMKLSNQAMGAIMMALQKSLLEQSDIVPVLKSFQFQVSNNEELTVKNPPNFKIPGADSEETKNTTGSD